MNKFYADKDSIFLHISLKNANVKLEGKEKKNRLKKRCTTKLLKRSANPNKRKNRVSNNPITPFPNKNKKENSELPEVHE